MTEALVEIRDLAAVYAERDPVYGFHPPARGRDVDAEIGDVEKPADGFVAREHGHRS